MAIFNIARFYFKLVNTRSVSILSKSRPVQFGLRIGKLNLVGVVELIPRHWVIHLVQVGVLSTALSAVVLYLQRSICFHGLSFYFGQVSHCYFILVILAFLFSKGRFYC